MRNRTPINREDRPALPDFTPVPRQYHRHDGWTPARQKAFIEALADTGSVSRAAAMVNMAQTNCYTLRRAPGAEEFRRAWEAALDFGVARMKDIAFERAIEGQLMPVFKDGKLMGFSRKRNDALLMFCLRHYGTDANGKRTTVNYFSTRASSAASSGGPSTIASVGNGPPPPAARGEEFRAGAVAEASVTTVRTVINGDGVDAPGRMLADDRTAAALNGFAGVALDAEAEAAIRVALEACAARAREADAAYAGGGDLAVDWAAGDPGEPFVRLGDRGNPYLGELVPAVETEEFVPFTEDEAPWQLAGLALPDGM